MRRQNKGNWPLYAVWLIILVSTIAITRFYGNDGNSPMEMKIRSLKEELSLCINPLTIQIELLQNTLVNAEDPIKIQVVL